MHTDIYNNYELTAFILVCTQNLIINTGYTTDWLTGTIKLVFQFKMNGIKQGNKTSNLNWTNPKQYISQNDFISLYYTATSFLKLLFNFFHGTICGGFKITSISLSDLHITLSQDITFLIPPLTCFKVFSPGTSGEQREGGTSPTFNVPRTNLPSASFTNK